MQICCKIVSLHFFIWFDFNAFHLKTKLQIGIKTELPLKLEVNIVWG